MSDRPAGERTGTVRVRAAGGVVLVGLPAEALQTEDDRYLRMTPDQARSFATQVLHRADEAEGKQPTHRFIIDIPRDAP